MRIGIISSSADAASENIKQHLLGYFSGQTISLGGNAVELFSYPQETIFIENLDALQKDLLIFVSKHQSKAAIPSLCVHTPGNWGSADVGGIPRQLCTAPAEFLKAMFIALRQHNIGYDVVQEATHHGPFLKTPCAFVEIGSTAQEWQNPEAGEAVAQAILDVLSKPIKPFPSVIGIGGLHTCPNFTKLILGEYCLGHVCPKYALQDLDAEMLSQAIERTLPRPEKAMLAWKGLGTEKERIVKLLQDFPYQKLK
jgi:D-aminoacyl-tRNA deacylase